MCLEGPSEVGLTGKTLAVGNLRNVQSPNLFTIQQAVSSLEALFHNEAMRLSVFQRKQPRKMSCRDAGLSRNSLAAQGRISQLLHDALLGGQQI